MIQNWPDTTRCEALLSTDELTGAEREALTEYLTQAPQEWVREVDLEEISGVYSKGDMLALDVCSQSEAEEAESGYATALVKRVVGILQNHAS